MKANNKLVVVNLPNSPVHLPVILVPEEGYSDIPAGQSASQNGRWQRFTRMLSACAAVIVLVSTMAILAAG